MTSHDNYRIESHSPSHTPFALNIMKHTLFQVSFMRSLALMLIVLSSLVSYGQTVEMKTYDTTILGWHARVTMPKYFDQSTDSASLFVFMPGYGQVNKPGELGNWGFHSNEALGGGSWDGAVQLENGTHYPVYVTLIPTIASPRGSVMDQRMTVIFNRYRVKTTSIHLIGVSMGGQTMCQYASWLEFNNSAKKYKHITTVHPMRPTTTNEALFASQDGLSAPYIATGARMGYYARKGGKAMIIHQINDPIVSGGEVVAHAMNDSLPGSVIYYWTNFIEPGQPDLHVAGMNVIFNPNTSNLTLTYDPLVDSKPGNPLPSIPTDGRSGGENIYQWSLRQGELPLPASYAATTSVNYIRTWDAKAPEQSGNTLISKDLREVQQTTQYFDGLGRPLQTVVKQGSMITGQSPVDLVAPVVYDGFGREAFKYLPAPSTATNATKDDGSFKLDPFTQQATFYNQTDENKNPLAGQGESHFHGETRFEASPLNRMLETAAPGKSWTGTMGAGTETARRSVKTKYYVNTALDKVRIWNVVIGTTGSFSTYNSSGIYPAGTLYKTLSIDEDNKQVVEFKDKEGKVILKKVQLTASDLNGAGSSHAGWLCTYYLYDDLGNLRLVIQPRGVAIMVPSTWESEASFSLTNTAILHEQCFRYEYDHRRRMIIKKTPGAGQVDMVYDVRDRLVMTQDAKLKATNQYLVTRYDHLNRPVETGLWTSTSTPQTHRNSIGTSLTYPEGGTYAYLTRTGYDHYNSLPAAAAPLDKNLDVTQVNATYGFTTSYNTAPDYAQPLAASEQVNGLVTWTETRVLGTATSTYTVNIYDAKARLIQVKAKNHLGGTDVFTTQHNWAGQPLVTLQKQEKPGDNAQTSFTVTRYVYDDLGRLVKTDKKLQHSLVNSNALPTAYTPVSRLEYDALGQVKQKSVGNKPGTTDPLSVAKHRHNIRGWLLDVNKDYIAETAIHDRYFGFELSYDKNPSLGVITPQYNGNISGMLWKSEGDQAKRRYNYSYDAVNRLTAADFTQHAGGDGSSATFNKANGMDFSVSNLVYDANGNILRMVQRGLVLNTAQTFDDLSYKYFGNNSNRLEYVNELSATSQNGKLGDFKNGSNGTTVQDYTYDVNGNLTQDLNKNITSITYNHLNLPEVITVTGKGTITYTYDAAGNKLKKTTVENPTVANGNKTITTTSSYMGGFVYESKTISPADPNNPNYTDKLQLATHEEGRIRPLFNNATTPNVPTGFIYDYFLKDHLGNTRMVLTEEQKQDIYPAATLEGSLTTDGSPNAAFIEKQYYNINSSYIISGNGTYPNHNGNPPVNPNPNSVVTATSKKAYWLNANTNKTGLGITLKVMVGDRIDILGKSHCPVSNTDGIDANKAILVLDILTGLLGGPTGSIASAAHGGVTAGQLNGITGVTGGVADFLSDQTTDAAGEPTVPKAYINYIFFDEQFRVSGRGFSRVGGTTVKSHTDLMEKIAPKSGYVYIYISNESPVNVYFDNLQVIHTRGPILEETHYYPFGLTMAGISSKALNNAPENKYKYNKGSELQNKEFSDGSGLEWYATQFRMLDPQIGRWHQIDPKPDYAQSPYSAMSNNPILHNDPLGDTSRPIWLRPSVQERMRSFNNNASNTVQVKGSVGVGVGVSGKVGKVGGEVGASGPQAEVKVNLGGEVSGGASLASAGAKITTPVGEGNAGVSVGNLELKDGKLDGNLVSGGMGVDPSLSASKKVGEGNVTQKLGADAASGDVSLGAKLGLFGISVKVNVIRAANALEDAVGVLIEYTKETIKDKMPSKLGGNITLPQN